nr:polysaccharide deacetylase family protein [Kineococcus aurantiacus]
MVRIEDVGPDADPTEIRAVADYLASQSVPFTLAVYPRYVDPLGTLNDGVAEDYTLSAVPAVVNALKYAKTRGGTILMHGYTHQYSTVANPYDGVSANDFEFFRAHVDASNTVVYDGPVPEDSTTWATARLTSSDSVFTATRLGSPTIFEFPHYAGSATDYRAVAARFATRYDRGLYFGGLLTGAVDSTRLNGQYFPYAVKDLYGTKVLPECVGNVEPEPFNNHPARLPADLVATARANLVVRDGFASFFYHPYLGITYLQQVVTGIKALGYTFVAAGSV